MAKKRPKPQGKQSKQSQRDSPSSRKLFDRRLMEKAMRGFAAGLEGLAGGGSPLEDAQDLIYEAFETDNENKRLQLAEKALRKSPDCADAYVLLAENAKSRKEALDFYEQGVAAGERALGPRAFKDDVGYFWGLLETRPYMRAREGLAHALWAEGRRDEAVAHLQDMLRLNPNDNQGIRYTLAGFLLFLDRDEDLAKLLAQYPDEGSATWAYTRALLAFRQQGDTPETRNLLKSALKANKHVPAYLLGEKHPSSEQLPYYSPGDDSEALMYIQGSLVSWKATSGALAWLGGQVAPKKRKPNEPAPQGPTDTSKKKLARLLQQFDVWQADFQQLPNWVEEKGKRFRPWLILVASRSNDLILALQIVDEKPSSALLWKTLADAIQRPAAGEPHRPTEIVVRADEAWEVLNPHIEEIAVHFSVAEQLDQLDFLFEDFLAKFGGKPLPGLLDSPGVTPEQVAGFFDAAASFFEQAPWKKVGFESAIKIECAKYPSGPWYAVLMGQSGLMIGVALYDDLAILRRMFAGNLSDEEGARETVATTVTFGNPSDLPPGDLEAAQRHGWKVARADAYPCVFRKEPGLSVRPPLAWELELLEACLRAIPDFVKRRKQDDAAAEEMSVAVHGGEVRLRMGCVE